MQGNLVLHQNVTSGIPDDLEDIILGLLEPTTDPCDLGVVYVSEGHTSGSPEDYIEIYNSGNSDCSLEGFMLDDSDEFEDFTFGDVTIPAGGYWLGYEDDEGSFSSGLSADGDEIWFASPGGDTVMVTLDVSQELDSMELSQSFDANGIGCYTMPTPGEPNSECITLSNEIDNLVPEKTTLYQNFPNPFNPTTTIRYDLSQASFVTVTVYDMLGNVVRNLVSDQQGPGYRSVNWNATNNLGQSLSAGVYLYKIQIENFVQTKKMILLK